MKGFTGRCQRQGQRLTVNQRGSHGLFQQLYPATERRLAHMLNFGCTGEMSGSGQRHKVF